MKYVNLTELNEIRKKVSKAQSRFKYLDELMSEIISDIDKAQKEKQL